MLKFVLKQTKGVTDYTIRGGIHNMNKHINTLVVIVKTHETIEVSHLSGHTLTCNTCIKAAANYTPTLCCGRESLCRCSWLRPPPPSRHRCLCRCTLAVSLEPFTTFCSFFERFVGFVSGTKIFTCLIVSFLHLNAIVYLAHCWTAVSFLLNQSTIVKWNRPLLFRQRNKQSQATVEPLGQCRERFKSITVAVDAPGAERQ